MSRLLNKFSLSSVKFNNQIGAGVALIWCVVLICTISSILSQPFNNRQRIFWIAFVIAVPIIGVLAYIPFSFRKEDLPHIFLPKKKKTGHGSTKSGKASSV